jgi:DNA-binding NarL/FixJ family response regulator
MGNRFMGETAASKNNTLPGRILLVDDHPLVLSGLGELLRGRGSHVATARRLEDATRLIEKEARFDLLLLDINLGRESGLSLLEHPPGNMPEQIVLLSGVAEQEWVMQGFALGAHAFIPKSSEVDEVLAALLALAGKSRPPSSGWVWVSERKQLLDAHDVFPKHTVLTPKEREVFMQLRQGKLDKQIADELGLSVHTVRVHVRAIKRKRGHSRRFELDV